MFIITYITLQWPLKCTICGVYCSIHYITTTITIYNMWHLLWHILHYTMTITMYNMWRLLWHILHYNDHYNGQYVTFIVAYIITLQQPLQCTIVVQLSFGEGRTCCFSARMKVMIGSVIYSQHQGRRECASTEDLLHTSTPMQSLCS
jgi:hypothetical protein